MAPQIGATTRQEIVRALSPAGQVSMTAKYLAGVLELPVRAVRDELTAMGIDGTVKSRTHRSGEVLYRLRDKIDAAWDAQNGLQRALVSR